METNKNTKITLTFVSLEELYPEDAKLLPLGVKFQVSENTFAEFAQAKGIEPQQSVQLSARLRKKAVRPELHNKTERKNICWGL